MERHRDTTVEQNEVNPEQMAASHQGYDVFLCHAGENKAFVRQLVDRLENDGIKKDQIFYDEISLQPGDELDSIIKVIESPSLKLFVFVVSKYCFESNKTWIRAEWEAALENNKQIFPIWLDDNNDGFKAFGNLVREFSYKLRKIIAQKVNPQEIWTSLPGLSEKICSLVFGDQHTHQRPLPSTNVGLSSARQSFMPGILKASSVDNLSTLVRPRTERSLRDTGLEGLDLTITITEDSSFTEWVSHPGTRYLANKARQVTALEQRLEMGKHQAETLQREVTRLNEKDEEAQKVLMRKTEEINQLQETIRGLKATIEAMKAAKTKVNIPSPDEENAPRGAEGGAPKEVSSDAKKENVQSAKPKMAGRKEETNVEKGPSMGKREQSPTGKISHQVSENPWKPYFKKHEGKTADDETEKIFRKVKGVLNKLTPQKFQTLCQQVLDLDIVTEERLKGVVDLVFEHAIAVEKYSVVYANMCRCLIHLNVPIKDNPKQTVSFRKLLLNGCQREFDNKQKKKEGQKKIELAKNDTERRMMEVELEQEMTRARRRSLGNIRFIGELFKLKMLTENIMHDCVATELLKSNDEESLEGLCILLTTIGKDLDVKNAKPRMDQYFQQMDKIIKHKKTSSRVRFMIQDVLELRMNNWVPKRDNNPKTIDQIHKEATLEEAEDNRQPKLTPAIGLESTDEKQGIPIQQERHPHAAPSPHDMNKGQVSSQGPPPVVGTPPTGPSPGPQMSQQTQMYASVSMSQGHRSSQPKEYYRRRSSGPTANVQFHFGPGYSAPQTVTSAPPPQMFQHPNQMIPGHVPQQAYAQPTLFIPQQYRPQAIPKFQPPQPTIQSATAYFQPTPQGPGLGGTQITYRTVRDTKQPLFTFPAPTDGDSSNEPDRGVENKFPPGHPQSVSAKRERKIVKIVDNTGRDVTEEILSGERGASSPTLPKSTNN